MKQSHLLAIACALGGFVVGSLASGVTVAMLAYSSVPVAEPMQQVAEGEPRSTSAPSQRIVLSVIKPEGVGDAIATMGLPHAEQKRLREEVESGKHRLLWLTLWDWEASNDRGDTVSITSGDYRRLFKLNDRRTTIAVPEPKNGYLEFRGEQTEDGTVSISLLSGAQPITLPGMTLGQSVKVEIDSY